MMDYGERVALERAEKSRQRRESQKPSAAKAAKGTKTHPSLSLYPLDKYKPKGSQGNIEWDGGSTLSCASELAQRVENGNALMQMLVLGTGYGKTAIAVGALAKLQEASEYDELPFIIVAPRAVVEGHGWHETICSYNESHPENRLSPYAITTFDKLANVLADNSSRARLMKEIGDDAVLVLDEVHAYKNPTSKRSKQLAKIGNLRKIGLTATPLTNDVVMDTASYLIMAGFYRNKTNFLDAEGLKPFIDQRFYRLNVYDKDGSVNEALWPGYADVRLKLASVMYQPSITSIDDEMPDVSNVLIQLPRNLQLESDMASLSKAYRKRMFESATDLMLAMCERVCSDNDRVEKCVELALADGVKQPLIFFWHTSTRDVLIDRFAANNVTCQVLDGEHSINDIDRSDVTSPILVQYRAGAEGVEFKESNTTIFYENQFSYVSLKQAKGRNVRRGCKNEITHYSLVSPTMFDQELFDKVSRREELNESELAELAEASLVDGGKW